MPGVARSRPLCFAGVECCRSTTPGLIFLYSSLIPAVSDVACLLAYPILGTTPPRMHPEREYMSKMDVKIEVSAAPGTKRMRGRYASGYSGRST